MINCKNVQQNKDIKKIRVPRIKAADSETKLKETKHGQETLSFAFVNDLKFLQIQTILKNNECYIYKYL
jgi:hypothetical protein